MKILNTYVVWLKLGGDTMSKGFLYECENNKWFSHRVNQFIELTEEEAREILVDSQN